jgi:hypothetical protein
MATQQRDYLLRLIEELRRFLSEIVKFREAGNHDAALMAIMHAQQRLFARPASQFMGLAPAEQFRLLVIGETVDAGCEKCIAYATLLEEAARVYEDREQTGLGMGARQLARQILLLATEKYGAETLPHVAETIARLEVLP